MKEHGWVLLMILSPQDPFFFFSFSYYDANGVSRRGNERPSERNRHVGKQAKRLSPQVLLHVNQASKQVHQ